MNEADKARWVEDVLIVLMKNRDRMGMMVHLSHFQQREILYGAIEATVQFELDAVKGFAHLIKGDAA